MNTPEQQMEALDIKFDVRNLGAPTLAEIVNQFAEEYMVEHPGTSVIEARQKAAAVVMEMVKESKIAGLASLLTNTPVPVAANRKERRRQAAIQRKMR